MPFQFHRRPDIDSRRIGLFGTRRFARRAGIPESELRRAWAGLDPLGLRDANAGKPALLVNARWDAVVPRDNALKLHEAFPSSRQVWVPFGHYSSILHLLWIPSFVARDFAQNLLAGPAR
jgi:pimeloyl-ACP methyl ester carboxylesterase